MRYTRYRATLRALVGFRRGQVSSYGPAAPRGNRGSQWGCSSLAGLCTYSSRTSVQFSSTAIDDSTRSLSHLRSTIQTRAMSSWDSASVVEDGRKLSLESQDLDFFANIPSLRRWVDTPGYSAIGTTARIPRTDGENDLFAITLKSLSTIPHWLLVVHDEAVAPLKQDSHSSTRTLPYSGNAEQPNMVLLVNLEQGTNGFRGVAHGGLLCALLDESLSYCVEFARQARTKAREPLYTANLNIDFRQPVRTPGPVAIKCWTSRSEGRKYWLEAQIEDANGRVCVQAKGLWIHPRPEKM